MMLDGYLVSREIWCERRGLAQIGAYVPTKARHYPPSRHTRKNRPHSRTWHMMTSGQVFLSLEGVFKLHLWFECVFKPYLSLGGVFELHMSSEGVFELHLSLGDVLKTTSGLQRLFSNYILAPKVLTKYILMF